MFLLMTSTLIDATAQDDSDSTVTLVEIAAEDVTEPDPPTLGDRSSNVTWTISTRYAFERRAGFTATDTTRFVGPPIAFRSRFRAKLGRNVAITLVADHDAGEGLHSPRRIADFAAVSLTVTDLGPVRRLALGNIRPRFGLGLSMWVGLRMSRLASSTSSYLRPSGSVQVSGSAYEGKTVQGLGLDVEATSRLRVLAFAGKSTQDAHVDETGTVVSIPTTGLHRNVRETRSDNRLAGILAGCTVLFEMPHFSTGIFGGVGSTDLPIGGGARPYQRYRFSGRRWRGASAFASVSYGKTVRVATEQALDPNGSQAGLLVARVKTSRRFEILGSWRHYPATFETPHGAPPGATGGGTGNEIGWSLGLKTSRGPFRIAVYRDVYRKPWLQADSYRPSVFVSWGFDAEGELLGIRFLVRHGSRLTNREASTGVLAVSPFRRRERLRIRVRIAGERSLEPSLDVALVRMRDGRTETGHGIGQRLVWRPTDYFVLTAGSVFFNSASGNSGIYLYEPDLPDYLSVPLLSGSGQRLYLILNLNLTQRVALWTKYAATQYERERIIGTGVDKVTTRGLHALSFALRIRM